MPVSKTASNKKTPKTSQKVAKEVAPVEKKVVQNTTMYGALHLIIPKKN